MRVQSVGVGVGGWGRGWGMGWEGVVEGSEGVGEGMGCSSQYFHLSLSPDSAMFRFFLFFSLFFLT